MPELNLYHLTFPGTLHMARRGVGEEATATHLPADTLFSALIAAHVEIGGTAEDIVDGFPGVERSAGTAPFLLTSAFPYAGQVRFYPPPPLTCWNLGDDEALSTRIKELKRVAFVSEAIFEKIRAGDDVAPLLPPDDEETEITSGGLYLQNGKLWLTVDEVEKLPDHLRLIKEPGRRDRERPNHALRYMGIWLTHQVPRVTVDRINNASNIFHTQRLTFTPGCGLWFGIGWPNGSDKTREAMLHTALEILADSGLGGNRGVGYGHFHYKQQGSHTWPDPEPNQRFMTLSRYHPRADTEIPGTLAEAGTAYTLEPIGGWLRSPQEPPQRRRRVWMVAEGSILHAPGPGPFGDVTDVRPTYGVSESSGDDPKFDHAVWRYGMAFPVAFGGKV